MLLLTAALALLAPAAPAAGAVPAPVCGSLPRCHVVARADVDGDGRADTVALARRGADGALHGSVTVLVRTARATVVSTRRTTFQWTGPLWQGAALLDGHRGQELVVGASAGAHTRFFWALTWRDGRLVTLPAPAGGPTWVVDSAAAVVLGWQRTAADPVGLVRRRVVEGDPDTGRFPGRETTWRWRADGWHRVATRSFRDVSPRRAGSWAGWNVPGLDTL
jgi:hypothetical protein